LKKLVYYKIGYRVVEVAEVAEVAVFLKVFGGRVLGY
jgi:hypothetical protein